PVWFVLLLAAFGFLIKSYKVIPRPVLFCGGSSLLLLAGYIAASAFQKMQGNWSVFIYPSAIVFLCWFACEYLSKGKKWVAIGLPVSLLISFFALIAVVYPFPFRLNPFKNNLGWSKLAPELADAGYNPEENFLFGDKYQMSSIL